MWKTLSKSTIFKVAVQRWRTMPPVRKNQARVAAIAAGTILAALIVVFSYASLFGKSQSERPISGKNHSTSKKKPDKKTDTNISQPSDTPPSDQTIYPSSVLNLTNWKLTLPVPKSGSDKPQEIVQPQLANFALAPYFQLAGGGVQFQAQAGGATTKNSKYPRSELREMTPDGSDEASWSNNSGTHTMTIRQAITHLPSIKPELVAGQIHDASEYIVLIRLEGTKLFVQGDGKNAGTLDSNYQLGTQFTLQIIASDGHIRVLYNGAQKADYERSGSGYYFKAGCYTQSNPSKGDSADDYGQVVIYDLQVAHT